MCTRNLNTIGSPTWNAGTLSIGRDHFYQSLYAPFHRSRVTSRYAIGKCESARIPQFPAVVAMPLARRGSTMEAAEAAQSAPLRDATRSVVAQESVGLSRPRVPRAARATVSGASGRFPCWGFGVQRAHLVSEPVTKLQQESW